MVTTRFVCGAVPMSLPGTARGDGAPRLSHDGVAVEPFIGLGGFAEWMLASLAGCGLQGIACGGNTFGGCMGDAGRLLRQGDGSLIPCTSRRVTTALC